MNQLHEKGKSLENSFFGTAERVVVDNLKEQQIHHDQEHALRSISGIKNKSILDNAIDLGITVETFAALTLIPLLKVAWSDHLCDKNESSLILKFAHKAGVDADSPGYKLLQLWLSNEINPNLYITWKSYVEVLKEKLTAPEIKVLREEVIGRAKSVARASGGFLGLGSVSHVEDLVLRDLESVFK